MWAIFASVPMDPFHLLRIASGGVIFLRWLPWGLMMLAPITVWGDFEGGRGRDESPRAFLIAKDASVKVNRGGVADIEIAAIPNFRNQVTFEIIKPPAHGIIGHCRPSGDHTAAVSYRHDGSRDPLIDSFSFRVKSQGKSPSSPAVCTIRIISPPPVLVLSPETLDFGRGFPGTVLRADLMVRNIGGRKAEGRLVLPAGIIATKGERFRLEEGESHNIPLEFSPASENSYQAGITANPAFGSHEVRVRGCGKSRFEVLEKSHSSIEIHNLFPRKITLEINGTEGWEIPKSLVLNGGEVCTIALKPAPVSRKEEQAYSRNMKVTDGFTVREIPLPEPPRYVAPIVEIEGPPISDSLEVGVGTSISFHVINPGEIPKGISWNARSDNGGDQIRNDVFLKPGELSHLSYRWIPTLPGDAILSLSFVEEGVEVAHLDWKAHVGTHKNERKAKAPESTNVSIPEPLAIPKSDTPSEKFRGSPAIPPVLGLTVEVGNSWFLSPRVFLRWDGEFRADSTSIEELVAELPLSLNPGKVCDEGARVNPTLKSLRLDSLRLRTSGRTTRCEIKNLSPGWHVCRIALGPVETPVASSQFAVMIPPMQWSKTIYRVIGFLLLVCLILLWQRLRNS